MAGFGVDAMTFWYLAREGRSHHPDHQLAARNSPGSTALQVLLGEVREGLIDERTALRVHDHLTGLKVRLLGDRVSRRVAWQIAMEHDWPTLEMAECLAVTRLQADALVTIDPAMEAAAFGIVPVVPLRRLFEPE